MSAATKLSKADQQQLLAHLALMASGQDGDQVRDKDMWAAAVTTALVEANGGRPGGVPGQMIVKRSTASGTPWQAVWGFIESSGFSKLQVTERQSVYGLLASLVVKNAVYVSRETGAPLSPRLVANCSNNLAGLFDQAFPGYLRAGLAPIVARRLTGVRHADQDDDIT